MRLGVPKTPSIPDIGTVGLVQAAEKYAKDLMAFYNIRAWWHRRFYRLTGITVILTGSSLPVLTSLDYPGKDLSISILGVVIAAATALAAFYHWDESWALLRNTEILISREYLRWGNRQADDPAAQEAARKFLVKLVEIRLGEADQFFALLAEVKKQIEPPKIA